MQKIIAKYIFLLTPVILAIIFIKSQTPTTNAEAVKEVVNSEYITDLSTLNTSNALSTWGDNKEGSAKFLSGRTGIVTFFVGDDSTEWSKSDITTVCNKLNIAAEYLIACGEMYQQSVELIYNQDDMLFYEWSEFKIKDWDKNNYQREVYNWIDKDINCEKLIKKYDLDGLAFLVVLNGSGISFATPHSVENKTGYYEVAYIYLFDKEYPDRYESPAAYAHELLHLFGAVDLYDYDGYSISTALEEYIQKEHPNEIMYTTYHNGAISVSNDIEQEFSPITAYEVGFLSTLDELDKYPELEKKYPGCFSEKDGKIVLDKDLITPTPHPKKVTPSISIDEIVHEEVETFEDESGSEPSEEVTKTEETDETDEPAAEEDMSE